MITIPATSVQAILASGYKNHLIQCEQNVLLYSEPLAKASLLVKDHDKITANALNLLALACSPILNSSNPREPFNVRLIIGGKRTIIPSDFDKSFGELFSELMPSINDSELASRIGDLAWLITRNHKSAKAAINKYIESSESKYCSENWSARIKRLERALRLSVLISQRDKIELVINRLQSHLDKNHVYYNLLASIDVLNIFMDLKLIDPLVIAKHAVGLSDEVTNKHNFDLVITFMGIADRAFTIGKNYLSAQDARLKAADVLIQKALLADNPGNKIAASHFMQQAITALQNCKGQQDRVKELQKLLSEIIKASYSEMKTFAVPIDISDITHKAILKMHEKDKISTLLTFAALSCPMSRKKLEEQVLEQAKITPMQSSFSKKYYSSDGRIVAIIPPLLHSKGDEYDRSLAAYCYHQASYHHSLLVNGVIIPARNEILKLHQIDKHTLTDILQYCTFIPSDRLSSWAKGILAGFDNDFDVALSLLMPQFEHALRQTLEKKGIVVWRVEQATQIHSEMLLSELLEFNETRDLFGEDMRFELKGLLTDRTGHNIRNEGLHGILSEPEFTSTSAVYLWWLFFHIAIRFSHFQSLKKELFYENIEPKVSYEVAD